MQVLLAAWYFATWRLAYRGKKQSFRECGNRTHHAIHAPLCPVGPPVGVSRAVRG